jgi:hypothetical protein
MIQSSAPTRFESDRFSVFDSREQVLLARRPLTAATVTKGDSAARRSGRLEHNRGAKSCTDPAELG